MIGTESITSAYGVEFILPCPRLSAALDSVRSQEEKTAVQGGRPMTYIDVVRAWKDPSYRACLGPEELALAPPNPAGMVDLSDDELKRASGVNGAVGTTAIDCTEYTFRRFRCCPKP